MATAKKYPEGLIGRKLGMSQIFAEDGSAVPVTVIELGPCVILGVRKQDTTGYSAVQFGFEERKQQRVTKAEMGHFAKAGKGAFEYVREMRCEAETLGWTELGQAVTVADVFAKDELVDVSGVSIGKGFAGVVKRYHVKGQPMTRGTHEYRRHIGSIGCRKTPARVFKNKRMPGHMGDENVTVQNLTVVAIRPEDNLLLVKGCVPGAKGALVEVRKAMKSYNGPVKKAEQKAA